MLERYGKLKVSNGKHNASHGEWSARSFNILSGRRSSGRATRFAFHRSPEGRTRSFVLQAVSLFALVLLAALIVVDSHIVLGRFETPPYCPLVSFITPRGTTLCADGHPLRLIGYNWRWMGENCPAPTDVEIDQAFTQIQKASKANIVRTAFYQSGSNGGSYADFGRYIRFAKKHHLYILPMLANQWTNCELSGAPKTAAWYQRGYTLAGDGYPLSYRDYVKHLAAHYANEPTIAFWQLVNEPDVSGSACGAPAAQILRSFADDMTSVIKSADPHHLVDLGAPGNCAGDNTADYQRIVGGAVGVADVWHDYGQVTTPLPSLLRQRLEALQRLHKPAFVGESGICADVGINGACMGAVSQASLSRRASLFDGKLATGFDMGLSGYIIWNKGSQSVQDDIGPGDPTESVLAKYTLMPPVATPE